MDNIIVETILYFYRDNIGNCIDMVKKLELENPMNYGNINACRYKILKFFNSSGARYETSNNLGWY